MEQSILGGHRCIVCISRVASRKDEIVRWTSLKTSSLQVLTAVRDDKDDVTKFEWTNYARTGAAAPGKLPGKFIRYYVILTHRS